MTGIEAVSKAIGYEEFWTGFDAAKRNSLFEAISSLEINAPAMEKSLIALAETIAGLPRVTTRFNSARRTAIAAIENVRKGLMLGN